ncbi:SDR family oxidoreductase [Pseudomaricurvus alkylphenolicus]|uniref:SDR family oxidoreductase n=1 Tax=Pseudomaricurvus alkylphenolicus TaxID=1306991 RepID=UPI00141DC690|nr:SDR family oxidoreductase [Pseudomaricurvus alkylphenolicus]NIB42485.1 SDR family oxidoreductase [Pseudomaricurvus alkylphenolicus]
MSTFQSDVLQGKVAFVAGGTSGINLEIARNYARLGARVAVMSRSQERVDRAIELIGAQGAQVMGIAADVRDYEAVSAAIESVVKTFGKLDIVVSGAAGNFVCPAEQLTAKGFKTVVDIDLNGTFHVLRAAFDHANSGCSMINISAPQSTESFWGQSHVAAAKAGIDMLTRSLAAEWGPRNIRVNAIVPGPIEGTEGMARLTPTPEMEKMITTSIALRRYGSTQDIADMATFLATNAANYVTGTIMYCDGGQVLSGGGAQHAFMEQLQKQPS